MFACSGSEVRAGGAKMPALEWVHTCAQLGVTTTGASMVHAKGGAGEGLPGGVRHAVSPLGARLEAVAECGQSEVEQVLGGQVAHADAVQFGECGRNRLL